MRFKSPISVSKDGTNKSNNESGFKGGKHHLHMYYCKPSALESSKGKSNFSGESKNRYGLSSSGGATKFAYNSDFKRRKGPSGIPISASKFVDENGSPQSGTISLKKPNASSVKKSITPLKNNYFSPEENAVMMSG